LAAATLPVPRAADAAVRSFRAALRYCRPSLGLRCCRTHLLLPE
jgi:hypothetical protein